MGNIDTGKNGSPWIFNAAWNNANSIVVKGGTFNADVNHKHWFKEAFVPKNLALKKTHERVCENCKSGSHCETCHKCNMWTVVPAVAYVNEMEYDSGHTNKWVIREVGYATLGEAIAAAEANRQKTANSGKYNENEFSTEQITVIPPAPEVMEFTTVASSGTKVKTLDYDVIWPSLKDSIYVNDSLGGLYEGGSAHNSEGPVAGTFELLNADLSTAGEKELTFKFTPDEGFGYEPKTMNFTVTVKNWPVYIPPAEPECGSDEACCVFKDVDPDAWYHEVIDWAVPAMQWAVGTGIISGYDDGSNCIGPQDATERAHFAAMLMRMEEAYGIL